MFSTLQKNFFKFSFFCLTVKVRLNTLELEAFELRRNTHPRAKQFFKKPLSARVFRLA